MSKEMKEAKKPSVIKFAGTMLKVIGGIVAAGVILTYVTDKVMTKVTEKREESDEE